MLTINKRRFGAALAALFAIAIAALGAHAQVSKCGPSDHACQIAEGTTMISADARSAAGYIRRGDALYNSGEYAASLKDYSKWIELDTGNAQAYSYRGEAYYKLKQYGSAISDLTKSLAIKADANTLISRGNAYDDNGNSDAAIADYNQAIRLATNNSSAYYNRGVAYAKQKKYDLAIADYTKSIEADPTYPSPYRNRGSLYELLGNPAKAAADKAKYKELKGNQ